MRSRKARRPATSKVPAGALQTHNGHPSRGGRCVSARYACSGGEGNRTPVRDSINFSVYVCILPIEVSEHWPAGGPCADKFAVVLPDDGKRAAGLAQICDTHVPPRAGCRVSTAGVTRRLRGERQVVVGDCDFPECFTRSPSTWTRSQSVTNPVEASHPRNRSSGAALHTRAKRAKPTSTPATIYTSARHTFRERARCNMSRLRRLRQHSAH